MKDKMTTPSVQRLEAWMKEVTDLLCYQPEIPLAHKKEICDALHGFQRELNPHGKVNIPTKASEVSARITEYLSLGGLFNPEQMDHDKVRDLMIDARSALDEKQSNPEVKQLVKVATEVCEWMFYDVIQLGLKDDVINQLNKLKFAIEPVKKESGE